MTCPDFAFNRRNFTAATATLGVKGLALLPTPAWSADSDTDINIVGPKPGYSPHIDTLVSLDLLPSPRRSLKKVKVPTAVAAG